MLGSLREAAALLLSRAQHGAQQVLRAVDWPAGEAAEEEPAAAAAAAAGAPSGPANGAAASGLAVGSRQQWRLLRLAAQDWLERCWQVRGGGPWRHQGGRVSA